jgi:predicted dehydrogenase
MILTGSAPLSRDIIDVPPGDPYARQLRHFLGVIRGEEEPVITGADATRTLAATLAVNRAAETGLPVTLS